MKKILLVLASIALISCSRPASPPPVTPAQPPTVESNAAVPAAQHSEPADASAPH